MKKWKTRYYWDGKCFDYECNANSIHEARQILLDYFVAGGFLKGRATTPVFEELKEVKEKNWGKLNFLATSITGSVLIIENLINLLTK